MRGINRVVIVGNAGHDPELRTTASGRTCCELRIATNRPVKTEDGWTEKADWHRVTLWDRQADFAARAVRKGVPVAVEGSLRTDTWTDEHDRRHSRTYVVARRLEVLAPRPAGATAAPPPPASAEAEDLPF